MGPVSGLFFFIFHLSNREVCYFPAWEAIPAFLSGVSGGEASLRAGRTV